MSNNHLGAGKNQLRDSLDDLIIKHYNIVNPHFSFCLGGNRKLSVNPLDARARKRLLSKGTRCLTRNQSLIYSFTKNLPLDLYLDIGSNYGELLISSPLFSSIPRIGIEANPNLIPYLNKTILYNDDLVDTQIINKAVSSSSGQEIDFYLSSISSGKSSAVAGVSGSRVETTKIATTTIDELLRSFASIDFLLVKVDVEGHEPAVFKGACETNMTVPNIVYLMEYNTRYIARSGVDPSAFLASLANRFTIFDARQGTSAVIKSAQDLRRGSTVDNDHTDLIMYIADSSINAGLISDSVNEAIDIFGKRKKLVW